MTAPRTGKRNQLISEANVEGLKQVAADLKAVDPLGRRVTLDEALTWLLDQHWTREGTPS
jgi:hypothetical protein